MGPAWSRSARAAQSPVLHLLPTLIQPSAQLCQPPALQVQDLRPGRRRLPGVALTSGSRVRSCCPRAWAPAAHRARPAWLRSAGAGLPARASPGSASRGGLRGRGRGRSWVRSAEPRRSDAQRHRVPSGAQPPPLTRAAGSSPWRRRPRAAEGRGQRQQIGELLGPRAQVSAQSRRARDGEQGSHSGPPRLSCSPRPPGAGLHFPAASVGPPPRRAQPPWGPGSAPAFCCCSAPFCSTRSAAGRPRR